MTARVSGDVPEAPWARGAGETAALLGVEPVVGRTAEEVRAWRRRYGSNTLRAAPTRSPWEILLAQVRSVLVVLLAAAALLALVLGEALDAAAIAVVLVVNAGLGFTTELRAVRSMEALRRLGRRSATVRRDGTIKVVSADTLVPGDVVIVSGGDVVTADLRLIEASKLRADESTFTGESTPVDKATAPVSPDAVLSDRACMLFKGTAVTRGAGEALVVATGMRTELGRITRLVDEAAPETTPLEQRLERLGRGLVWIALGLVPLITLTGMLSGRSVLLAVQTGIALAVAAVPEGLPIIATIALARSMRRLAQRNALVNRLAAVETLGATSVLCADKTGTLTENRMTLATLEYDGGVAQAPFDASDRRVRHALEVGALCSDATIDEGDPLEVALQRAAAQSGIERGRLLEAAPEIREVAFDPEQKLMATVHREGAGFRVAVKGAPEQVLAACTSVLGSDGPRPLTAADREAWSARNVALAGGGLRVLAAAERYDTVAREAVYEDLCLVALQGLHDPPRPEVRGAISALGRAGVRVMMLTGDQPATARAIATEVGLSDASRVVTGAEIARGADPLDAEVVARVTPGQKLEIIAALQARGAVVAMTGDGVNDAPSLRKADIGVAMGQRGTEVAREAAEMVLLDDRLGTIVVAVAEGRVVFDNLRRFIVYLLSCNAAEVLVVALAGAAGAPLPLLPLQILFLNLVTDVFPALALGATEGAADIATRPPRPAAEDLLTRAHWWRIARDGALVAAPVLVVFALVSRGTVGAPGQAVTAAFYTLALAQLWHVFDMRGSAGGLVRNEVTRNPYVWGAIALCLGQLALAAGTAALVLHLVPLDSSTWAWVLGASLFPLVTIQTLLQVFEHRLEL